MFSSFNDLANATSRNMTIVGESTHPSKSPAIVFTQSIKSPFARTALNATS